MAIGSWIYDGVVTKPVYILRLNYDYWFEMAKADGQLEPEEQPSLTGDGYAYYVTFHGPDSDGSLWPGYGGHLTIEDAKAEAEQKSPSSIEWEVDDEAT